MSLPLSPYRRIGGILYLAGEVGRRDGKIVEGGIEHEVTQALLNIEVTLSRTGRTLANVVDVTVFLTDMAGDYEIMNETYARAFNQNKPARTTVEVRALPLGARVEFKCIASAVDY